MGRRGHRAAPHDSGRGGVDERALQNEPTATPRAPNLVGDTIADDGPLLFRQSGGCYDGSSAKASVDREMSHSAACHP